MDYPVKIEDTKTKNGIIVLFVLFFCFQTSHVFPLFGTDPLHGHFTKFEKRTKKKKQIKN